MKVNIYQVVSVVPPIENSSMLPSAPPPWRRSLRSYRSILPLWHKHPHRPALRSKRPSIEGHLCQPRYQCDAFTHRASQPHLQTQNCVKCWPMKPVPPLRHRRSTAPDYSLSLNMANYRDHEQRVRSIASVHQRDSNNANHWCPLPLNDPENKHVFWIFVCWWKYRSFGRSLPPVSFSFLAFCYSMECSLPICSIQFCTSSSSWLASVKWFKAITSKKVFDSGWDGINENINPVLKSPSLNVQPPEISNQMISSLRTSQMVSSNPSIPRYFLGLTYSTKNSTVSDISLTCLSEGLFMRRL